MDQAPSEKGVRHGDDRQTLERVSGSALGAHLAAELFIQMNDILIEDVAVIPLVQRASEKYGLATDLDKDNIAGGPFESLYWNIANWNRTS